MTSVCPLPSGPTLSGFRTALDGARMQELIEQHLLRDAELVRIEPEYVRYKGADGGLLAWRVVLAAGGPDELTTRVTARCAPDWRLRGEADRLRYRDDEVYTHLRSFALTEAADLLLLAFPVDRLLADLRRMLRGSRVRRILLAEAPDFAGVGGRISKRRSACDVVRYKPERRAVLRWTLAIVDEAGCPLRETAVWVRVHAERLGNRAALALDAARRAGVPCPQHLASPHAGLVVESDLAGRPAASFDAAHAQAAGGLLGRLHRTEAPPFLSTRSGIDELDAALRARHDLGRLAPDLGERAAALTDDLARWIPGPVGPTLLHGDFHPGQVLFSDAANGLVDFDRTCIGPPAYDLASFRAHVAHADPGRADSLVAALEEGYAEAAALPAARDRDWYAASAMLRYAMTPFRELRPDWPARARRLLEAARDALTRVRDG